MTILLTILSIVLVLLKFILFFFSFLVLLVLLVFSLPLRYSVNFNYKLGENPEGEINVNWAFGLIRNITIYKESFSNETKFAGFKIKPTKPTKPKETIPEETVKTEKQKGKSLITFSDIKKAIDDGVFRMLLEYLANLIRILKPKKLKIRIIFGLDDPSDTGKIFGMYSSVPYFYNNELIEVIPSFHELNFDSHILLGGFFIPITILWATLRLIIKKPIRKLIFEMRRRKRNGKK